MPEYIERDLALKALGVVVAHANAVAGDSEIMQKVCSILEDCASIVADLPAADVEPVIHAKWETDPEDIAWGNFIKRKFCTNCRKRPSFDKDKFEFILPPRCPNCGARMDGADE